MRDTKGDMLCPFVESFTKPETTLYTDENDSYNRLHRIGHMVCHGTHEWARDDDGDSIREVHVNSKEDGCTGLHNFLRPYCGVHKAYLTGDAAIRELAVNHKRISPWLVAKLVRIHSY
jgi:hypothetical protein